MMPQSLAQIGSNSKVTLSWMIDASQDVNESHPLLSCCCAKGFLPAMIL